MATHHEMCHRFRDKMFAHWLAVESVPSHMIPGLVKVLDVAERHADKESRRARVGQVAKQLRKAGYERSAYWIEATSDSGILADRLYGAALCGCEDRPRIAVTEGSVN